MQKHLPAFLLAFALILATLVLVDYYNAHEPPAIKQDVQTIVQTRIDTITKVETRLKLQIKYIDTSKITVIHDTLNALVPIDTLDTLQSITNEQLRASVKWHDSLRTCIELRRIDSIAIDTLSKIKPEIIKACTITEQAKSMGIGVLMGIAIKSLF